MTKLMKTIAASPFLRGFGSAIDLGGALHPQPEPSPTPWEDDAAAIRSDWEQVGRDLWGAMAVVQQEIDHGQTLSAK